MSKITYTNATDKEAVAFWQGSPHASVFTHPEVLTKLSYKVDWWLALRGNEPECLWPVSVTHEGEVGLSGFTYYVGPMWSSKACNFPPERWLARTSVIYEGLIELILSRYSKIEASLPIGLLDVRVFDWWNYHEKHKPRFNIKPRYTARINNLKSMTDEDIINGFRAKDKRYALRKLLKKDVPPFTDSWSPDDFFRLYEEVMSGQGVKVNNDIFREISALIDLVNLGYGEVIACRSEDNQKVIALWLNLFAKGVANAVIGLVDNSWKNKDLTVWMAYNSIKNARDKGAGTFDFNGANSPNRGDDKHSYGAEPILYFDIKYP